MAKYGQPTFVNVIRGSVGGAVFTRARGINTIRVRIKPNNPQTVTQTAARTAITEASREWYNELTTDERLGWTNAAVGLTFPDGLGGSFHPTGNQYYVQLTAKLKQITPHVVGNTTPPASSFSGDTIAVTAAAAAGHIAFTASAANGAGITTELLVAPVVLPTRHVFQKGYRHAEFHAYVTGTLGHNTTLAPGWYAAAYQFVLLATGQVTGFTPLGYFLVT